MAVPKRKVSKARRDKRRSSTWKLALPGMIKCSKCGEYVLKGRVCKACGYYYGKEVLKVEKGGLQKYDRSNGVFVSYLALWRVLFI